MNSAPPLGLAFIAAALRDAGHVVTIIDAIGDSPHQINVFKGDLYTNGLNYDEIFERIPKDVELLGFSLMFTENWMSDRALLRFLGKKMPGIPFIAGGEHISAIPELCMQQVPALTVCVLGEGEETVTELVAAIGGQKDLSTVSGIVFREGDALINSPRRNRVKDIGQIPWPAWDLFPLDNYKKYALQWGVTRGYSLPILATRGCPYSCTFCSSPQMWGTRYYMRTPMDVANEMEQFKNEYGVTNFDFYDLTAIIKRDWIIEFSQEIMKRKLNITWQIPGGTRSEAIDAEVARHLYLSGCRNITYAPESGSKDMLRIIKKKISINKMLESMNHSYREGMNIKINIILGFPEEKHKNFLETIWFLIQCSWAGAHDSVPSIFSPYPGSAMFNMLVEQGKIDIATDDYFQGILDTNDFFGKRFYNYHVSGNWLRFYMFLYLVVFFASNYLFRPQRIFKSFKNLWTKNYESRGEFALAEFLNRKEFKLKTTEEEFARTINAEGAIS
jgi:radical SAM superfamily enzyme YgiQ (UPF0313 family)